MSDRKQDGQSPALDKSLPRGRHGLPPDVVETNQRSRVSAAVATIIAEQGYAGLTVERLQSEAGISRSTFYDLYDNKQDAVLQAYDSVLARFLAMLKVEGRVEQAQRVRSAIGGALAFAATEPEQAQLLAGLSICADPLLARHVFNSHDRLAIALCGRAHTASYVPDVAAQALVGAVSQVLARHLLTGKNATLHEVEAPLVTLALTPFFGRKRAAAAAESQQ